jgi:fucose permease
MESTQEVSPETIPSIDESGTRRAVLSIPGVKATLLSFFCDGSILVIIQIWVSTYLTMKKGLPAETAAGWTSAFFIFIVVCRLIIGVINEALSSRTLIRLGSGIMLLGCALLFLPGIWFSLTALVLLGFGMAPIVPGIIYETPRRFGAANSTAITGYQFAVSNIGVIVVPTVMGLIITNISMAVYPFFLLLFILLLILSAWWDAFSSSNKT